MLIIFVALFLSSCANRQEISLDDSIEELVWDSDEIVEDTMCDCHKNPYIDDVEGDPNFFKKIKEGDTDAFEIFYLYTTRTYKREDILNVIKYALLLEKKYHYSHGFNRATGGYLMLYEIDSHLSARDKERLVLYCWKSYYVYHDLASVYTLKKVYKGDLDPSMRDEEQYKICDSIIKTRREMCCRNIEKNE